MVPSPPQSPSALRADATLRLAPAISRPNTRSRTRVPLTRTPLPPSSSLAPSEEVATSLPMPLVPVRSKLSQDNISGDVPHTQGPLSLPATDIEEVVSSPSVPMVVEEPSSADDIDIQAARAVASSNRRNAIFLQTIATVARLDEHLTDTVAKLQEQVSDIAISLGGLSKRCEVLLSRLLALTHDPVNKN